MKNRRHYLNYMSGSITSSTVAWITHTTTHNHTHTTAESHTHTHTLCHAFCVMMHTYNPSRDCWSCEKRVVWCGVCLCVCVCVCVCVRPTSPTGHPTSITCSVERCRPQDFCHADGMLQKNATAAGLSEAAELKRLMMADFSFLWITAAYELISPSVFKYAYLCLTGATLLWPYLPRLSGVCSRCCTSWVILVHWNNLDWPWIAPLYCSHII